MAVQPATARLMGGSSQTFTCDIPNIKWIKPAVGDLVEHGQSCVYTAPPPYRIWFSRDIVLKAANQHDVAQASAVITLVSATVWIGALAILYILMFLALVYGVVRFWPAPAPATWIELSPAIVTVPHGYMQQFEARIWNGRDQGVTWAVNDGLISPNGLFTAPAGGKQVVLTVSSAADHNLAQSALILLSEQGLYVQPTMATLLPGEPKTFKARTYQSSDVTPVPVLTKPDTSAPKTPPATPAAPSLEWLASDPSVQLLSDQSGNSVTVKAPSQITSVKRVILTLVDKADRGRQASAVVYLAPTASSMDTDSARTDQARDRGLLVLVFFMGALGALLGASRSLANFVGNDTFVPRWTLFYVFRPTFGAGLAVLVFFGYRIGALTTVKGVAPADPSAATFIAGMVGLFADTVLQKLKDVIMALFPTQDERKDKVSSTSLVPIIDSIEAAPTTMKIKGRNFAPGATVTVNGKSKPVARVTTEEIIVTLDGTVTGDVKVVVSNPDNATVEFPAKIVVPDK